MKTLHNETMHRTKLLLLLVSNFLLLVWEGRGEAPVVIAVVEKISLNEESAMGGQRPSNVDPLFRVQLNITEVLRGPQDFVGKKIFTLCRNRAGAFDHLEYIVPNLKLGDEGMFALYKETDGLWYDMGLGAPLDPKDPWLYPPRSIKRFHGNYESIVRGLRGRRDHPKKNSAEIKSVTSASVIPPAVVTKPNLETFVTPPKPVTESLSYQTLWLGIGAVVMVVGIWLLRRK